jgi:Zn-dependent protease
MPGSSSETSWVDRAVRVAFGLVTVPFFAALTWVCVTARAAMGQAPPKSAPPDAVIVAITLLVAVIAAYGLDQLLTGFFPSRSRWFSRAEDMLGETVASVWGAPVRVHWSAPFGLLLVGGSRPGAWVGFLAVILAHELGHAVLVRRFGQRVVALSLHALGGECHWVGHPTSRQRTLIAWGGAAGQMVLAGVAFVVMRLLPPSFAGQIGDPLYTTLVQSNLVMAGFNLLPFPPLDGLDAWRPLFRRARRARRSAADPVGSLMKSVLNRGDRDDQ